jgi:uncharacterized protein with HEPN domain
MSDKELMVISTLEEILFSIELILKRFKGIHDSDAFLSDDEGLLKLDSISMRLIAIGEGFKNVDKLTEHKLLSNYTDIEWKNVKGVRDILSHHYFDIDAETIFNICESYLPLLSTVVKRMLEDIKKA